MDTLEQAINFMKIINITKNENGDTFETITYQARIDESTIVEADSFKKVINYLCENEEGYNRNIS